MKIKFSSAWKKSVQPRKQRKYNFNMPMHIKKEQLSTHLSKPLREKHGVRAVRVRVGDKVRVLRGTHKGKEGLVNNVDTKDYKVYVAKVEHLKKEGGSAPYPLNPTNVMIIELAKDKKRFKKQDKKE